MPVAHSLVIEQGKVTEGGWADATVGGLTFPGAMGTATFTWVAYDPATFILTLRDPADTAATSTICRYARVSGVGASRMLIYEMLDTQDPAVDPCAAASYVGRIEMATCTPSADNTDVTTASLVGHYSAAAPSASPSVLPTPSPWPSWGDLFANMPTITALPSPGVIAATPPPPGLAGTASSIPTIPSFASVAPPSASAKPKGAASTDGAQDTASGTASGASSAASAVSTTIFAFVVGVAMAGVFGRALV